MTTAWSGSVGDGLRYGALGLPLAFVALPLYVLLPNHYASATFGVPLATLGALLLGARLLDAIADPLDRPLRSTAWFARGTRTGRVLAVAAGGRGGAGRRGSTDSSSRRWAAQQGAALLLVVRAGAGQ